MDLLSSSSDGSRSSSSSSTKSTVLSIQCLKGCSKADEWAGNMLLTGDIVEELRIGKMIVTSPFKNGKSGVHKILHNSFKAKETSIRVRVRRGSDEFTELLACIMPVNEFVGKKGYMLRSIDDPNYAVGFFDRTEKECLELQASRTSSIVSALEKNPLQDGYVPYPWTRKMQETLSIPNSSSFYSILVLPKSSDRIGSRYNDLEDTLARAHAWINASQASGAPILFMNIQTESLLTKISGETASSTVNAGSLSDLSDIANTSLYGFEDYHGVDIGVVRAVRLWFSSLAGEIPVEIKIKDTDTKLGFSISRTEEGFIYISSVIQGDEDAPSSRSRLRNLYHQSLGASRILVVSRISNQKILPWMVSPAGAIRCYDTVSLSQKLSLHKHTKVPILMHVFLWDRSITHRDISTNPTPSTPENDNRVLPILPDYSNESTGSDIMHERDSAGECSFRFQVFALKSN
ncbi:unnamed protein product [Fraxinus pennsylvanica]|uniref:Uncharacterized protein n=1 Tax=Fraxinus pennsylvanica TaxID=56036 RepID=A0AAD1ZRT8_9LAMI|nr:unnamed protein product [Fraxinus pennsylvanica]